VRKWLKRLVKEAVEGARADRIDVFDLGPHDTLVVETDMLLHPEMLAMVRENLAIALAARDKALLFEGGIRISGVIRRHGPTSPPAPVKVTAPPH
jgi:hypothetical protein